MPKPKSELSMARVGNVGKISIIGPIGFEFYGEGMTYSSFKKALANLGDVNLIEVEINSPGGVVTDGIAMVNALREHPAIVHTYNAGQAASMGSVLLLSGDRAFIPDNAMTFIHKPLTVAIGNADDMRKGADELDKFEAAISKTYMASFNGSDEELKKLIALETWHTANEIKERFSNVTVIESGEQKAAATSEPLEICDVECNKQTILDRAVNAVRSKYQGNNLQEVDMPMSPEEKKEIVDSVVQQVTASVSDAIKAALVKEPEATKTVEVAFEGDASDPEAVKAHAEKVRVAQLKAAVDWNDLDSIKAYQAAVFGEQKTAPASSQQVSAKKAGSSASEEGFSQEELDAALAIMSPTKK